MDKSSLEYNVINKKTPYKANHLLKNIWLLLAFVVMLAITFNVARSINNQEKTFAQQTFEEQVNTLRETISTRMQNHEHILLGAAGLFAASETVSRDEFFKYIKRLDLADIYPGIQAVAFAKWFPHGELAQETEKIRQEGFPTFTVHPEGVRDNYAAIIYIEPFSKRNIQAFGFDMFSEPTRQSAMRYSVERDVAAMTSKVKLVQESYENIQPGVLIYLPIYKKNVPLTSPAFRWQALEGFVYSPYRMGDLMEGILSHRNIDLDFVLYDGTELTGNNLLYTSSKHKNTTPPLHNQQFELPMYGRVWTVVAASNKNFEAKSDGPLDTIALVFGSIFSVVVCFLFYVLASQRQRALALADEMTIDVREKNRALKLSEERFSLALESSSTGVWSWRFSDNSIQWDDSMYALFGIYGGEKLTGYDAFLKAVHLEDRDRVFKELTDAVEGKRNYDTEYRILWSDNSIHYVASRAKIIYEDGAPVSMIGTCWDITERKRMDKMKGEFVSTVSHELRTPLTSIAGALGLVVSGTVGELPEKVKQLLDIAYKNSQRLKLLINDLLDMEKLLASKSEFVCEVQPLLPLVEQAVAENQIYAEQFKIRYTIRNMKKNVRINVEKVRFLQFMHHFLSNAAKFSPENSEVIVVISTLEKSWIRISVIDTGIGIPEEMHAHIFEKFFQVDSSDTRKTGGVGLGLAITKEIVERMEGRVGFQSLVGVGSTFYAEFPIVDVSASIA